MNDLTDHLLTLTVRLRNAGSTAFAPLGLSWREAVMLLALERGCVRPTDLTRECRVLFPTMSGLGAKFAASGLIERNVRQESAREVTYDLTAKGRALCEQIRQAWRDNLPTQLMNLSDEEAKGLTRALETLRTDAEPSAP